MKRTYANVTTEAELSRPDRYLNAVIDYLRKENDQDLSKWFVTTLAEETNINIVTIPDGLITQADVLGDWWTMAIWRAGRDPDLRDTLCRRAVAVLGELGEVVKDWSTDDLWNQMDRQARARFHG